MSPSTPSPEAAAKDSSPEAAVTDSSDAVGRRRALAVVSSTATLGALAGCVGELPGFGLVGDVDLERLAVLNDDHEAYDVTLELQQGNDVGFHREFSLDAKDEGANGTHVDSEEFREGWSLDRGRYRFSVQLDGDESTTQTFDATVTELLVVVNEDSDALVYERI